MFAHSLRSASHAVAALCIVSFVHSNIALSQLRSTIRTVGDTTVVRTVGVEPESATRILQEVLSFGNLDGAAEYVFGSITGVQHGVAGTIWVFDTQVPILRQYDSTGRYLRSVGRGGQGPGEYARQITFTARPDGSIAVRTAAGGRSGAGPASARMYIYDGAGRVLSNVPAPTTGIGPPFHFLTSPGLVSDTAGTIYASSSVSEITRDGNGIPRAIQGLVRYRSDGTIADSLRPPSLGDYPTPPNNIGACQICTTREYWSFSRLGYFVGGRSDTYQIHLVQSNRKVVRIEREVPRINVSDAEWQSLSQGGRVAPRVKPYFQNVFTDHDGRVWVRVHVAAERIPESERVEWAGRGRINLAAIPSFREAVLYEVFGTDGSYLGRVELPRSNYPPTIKGDVVWSATLNSDGVPQVTKFRISPPFRID